MIGLGSDKKGVFFTHLNALELNLFLFVDHREVLLQLSHQVVNIFPFEVAPFELGEHSDYLWHLGALDQAGEHHVLMLLGQLPGREDDDLDNNDANGDSGVHDDDGHLPGLAVFVKLLLGYLVPFVLRLGAYSRVFVIFRSPLARAGWVFL